MIPDFINAHEFSELIWETRKAELHEFSRARYLTKHAVVYDERGMGKTALLHAFRLRNPVGYPYITILRGHEVEFDESLLAPFLLPTLRRANMSVFPDLLIIDDFDLVTSPHIREKVAQIVQSGYSWGIRLILSASTPIKEKVFEQYGLVVRLTGLPDSLVSVLFDYFVKRSDKHPDVDLTIRGMLEECKGNPALIMAHLWMLVTPDDVPYKNPFELERPRIIIEATPPLITEVRLINKSILDRIGRRPEAIRELTPRQFEELVAELYLERGYEVKLTQQTRDGGKDLIIMNRSDIGNFMIYAECKHHSPDRPVGVSVVSELHGRIDLDRATAGMVVTSSYFSPDAKAFQSKIEHQMSLIDFIKLSSMIEIVPHKGIFS